LIFKIGLISFLALQLNFLVLAFEVDYLRKIKFNPDKAAIGAELFFDTRISADDRSISCSKCHDPSKGWGDGQSLSDGYTNAKFFRNSKSLLNSANGKRFGWTGHVETIDYKRFYLDKISGTQFMHLNPDLLVERLGQVEAYKKLFKDAYGDDKIEFYRVAESLFEFQKTLYTRGAPYHLNRLSLSAQEGKILFEGKAKCNSCHTGELFTDYKLHSSNTPKNLNISSSRARIISLNTYAKSKGFSGRFPLTEDFGAYLESSKISEKNYFMTPPLLDLVWTAPYMHNGIFATLDEVVHHYNQVLKLRLNKKEMKALVDFLKSLSGYQLNVEPTLPLRSQRYDLIFDWYKKPNR
jgi:cytochrome c peroxidase